MELWTATLETLQMTIWSLLMSYVFGLPLGIITNETSRNGLFPNRIVNFACNALIGAGRAIPFIILMVLVLPLTRILVGTGIGTTATIVPLTIAAVPFVARTIEQSLEQVDRSIIEAAKLEGCSKLRIIFSIKIGSRLFDLVNSVGLTSIAIISYTAMSGAVGGGGLGNYAITYGFYRYDWNLILYSTLIIVAIVCAFQWAAKFTSRFIDWR